MARLRVFFCDLENAENAPKTPGFLSYLPILSVARDFDAGDPERNFLLKTLCYENWCFLVFDEDSPTSWIQRNRDPVMVPKLIDIKYLYLMC